ncbi:formylglycine-generating enzyme family protein [Adhaeribacter terreus]|uniref:Formylglycine-generating enzyme family protein n=1 Tax=Adhaeribacter terreus TaxID=529703 RepID=A0ABW0E9N4_9BACT
MYSRANLTLLFLLTLLQSCTLSQNPNSSHPADRSFLTDARYNQSERSFLIFKYRGYEENKVLKFTIKQLKPGKDFPDGIQQLENIRNLTKEKSPDLVGIPLYQNVPGSVFITRNLHCDEIEVSNIHWLEYLHYLKKDSSESVALKMQPKANLIKLVPQDFYAMDITGMIPEFPANEKKEWRFDTYLDHPGYRFFPVIGVSQEQAKAYCKWRSKFVTAQMHKQFPQTSSLNYNYRLPTEAEWEMIASTGFDKEKYPHALYPENIINIKLKVNPGAAGYLATKLPNPPPASQIKADIKKFNKTNSLTNPEAAFNTHRNLPYFLNLSTPFYVYAYPPNDFGIYNMIGNVAEMVAEEGIAKGGSWLEPLTNSKITDRKLYDKPAADIGFRCVCEVEKLK